MKILIAEDEHFSKTMLSRYVKRLGHEVIEATDGGEAWRILREGSISFLITDRMIPGSDGIQLIQRIRSTDLRRYVYIILVTARSDNRSIAEGMAAGADDCLAKPYDVDELRARVRAGERVVQLEERLRDRNAELETARRELEELHERMKRDLGEAAKIQQLVLPTSVPKIAHIDCAWVFQRCDELAGDIFNVFELDDKHIGFYLLDVAGHGVPAALLTVTLSCLLSPGAGPSSVLFSSAESGQRPALPSEIASKLNKRLRMSGSNIQFCTLLFGVANIETRELRFVSAGHPEPIYVPVDGKPRLLDCGGLPIGVESDFVYTDEMIVLTPGDGLVVYSDGLMESMNQDGQFFGQDRVLQCVSEKRRPLERTVEALKERAHNWCQGDWRDDVSVLAIGLKANAVQ